MLRGTQRLALRVGAFTLPLVVVWSASDSYILPKLLLARLLVIVLAGLWLARCALEGRLMAKRTPLDMPLAAFVGSAVLASFFAVNRALALFGAYQRYEGLLTILLYATLFWLTVQTIDGPDEAKGLLRVLLAAGYVAALFAIIQSVLGSVQGVRVGESAFTFAGLQRAQGTLGNPNLLATFLAMLLPLALDELLQAASFSRRLYQLNVLLMMMVALLLTFGRSAWIGAALGLGIVAAARFRSVPRLRLIFVPGVALVVVGLLLALPARGGLPIGESLLTRAASITDPASGSSLTRIHIWKDTIALIASRPLTGYGPDTFGLVYPHFETGNWTPGYRVDKAHADTLQVASSQGLLGLAAYLVLQLATLVVFWRARRLPATLAIFAAWLAYEIPTQVNFSWLPAAAPFWIFLAASTVYCSTGGRGPSIVGLRRVRGVAFVGAAVAGLVLTVAAVNNPYVAEQRFSAGLAAELHGHTAAARVAVKDALRLAPQNSVYAVEAGDLDLRSGDIASARGDYLQAARSGTADPSAYRSLAVIDELLGRRDEARWAAQQVVYLDPFGPAGRQLLDQLSAK